MTPEQRTVVLALATALAVPCEGLRQYAYRDVTGLPSVCMGATRVFERGVEMTDHFSVAQCKALLTDEMNRVIDVVNKCQPGLAPNVLAAFADLTYNAGPTAACNPAQSTAARRLKAGDFKGACNELPKWNKARVAGVLVSLPGLTKRREMERELCLS